MWLSLALLVVVRLLLAAGTTGTVERPAHNRPATEEAAGLLRSSAVCQCDRFQRLPTKTTVVTRLDATDQVAGCAAA